MRSFSLGSLSKLSAMPPPDRRCWIVLVGSWDVGGLFSCFNNLFKLVWILQKKYRSRHFDPLLIVMVGVAAFLRFLLCLVDNVQRATVGLAFALFRFVELLKHKIHFLYLRIILPCAANRSGSFARWCGGTGRCVLSVRDGQTEHRVIWG